MNQHTHKQLEALVLDQKAIDAIRQRPIPDQQLLIGGRFVDSSDGCQLETVSPIDGTRLAGLAVATKEDVDRAVRSARASFDKGVWSRQSPDFKRKVLSRLSELIEEHAIELAVLGVRDNGTDIKLAIKAEAGGAAATFRYYAEAIDKIYGEVAPTAEEFLGLVHREPVGVVGVIVPWNFPLMIAAWKIAPALAAGNSVVLKPAKTASLSLLRIAELALEAGLPEGVLNVVTGNGAVTGKAIGLHMDIDVVAFTGSGSVGRKLHNYSAASNLKRIYLELGGKSPHIVFEDAGDLQQVAGAVVNGIFRNAGQVCIAGSRLLVQSAVKAPLLDAIMQQLEEMVVGNPLDLNTDIGAIHSLEQLNSNLHYVEIAKKEGANCLTGGKPILQETGGYYMSPAIFTDVTPSMRIFQEEVFGPLLTVTAFDDESEAVTTANSTNYGLSAGLWTANLSRAHRMIRNIKAGLVHVNCYGGSDLTVPLGGVKQSGDGHDKSLHALDKYFDLKTAWIAL